MRTHYLMVGLIILLVCHSCNDKYYGEVSYADDHQIVCSAQISSSITKAPINSNFNTDFSTGVYAIQGNWKAGANGNNINNDNATVSASTGHLINFSKVYHYPTDGSTLTFYAYTPHTPNVSTLPVLNTSPVVTIPMTGQEDIMWATATGYRPTTGDPPINPVLTYNHRLTQLNFIFKSGAGYSDGTDKVTSFLLKGQPNTAFMTVGTGVCTYNGSVDMQLLTASQQQNGIAITTAGNNAGSLMTKPGTSFTIQATVKQQLSGDIITYNPVSFSLSTVMGNAHTVTITFKKTGVNVSCSITNWSNGNSLTITQ